MKLTRLIDAFSEWKSSPIELRAEKLQDLTDSGLSLSLYFPGECRDFISTVEKKYPESREKATAAWNQMADTFLSEIVRNVAEPIFLKTLK